MKMVQDGRYHMNFARSDENKINDLISSMQISQKTKYSF